jgi:chromosome segregation ATPase
METTRLMDGATRENQRLQAQLEGVVKFNEDRHAMFVVARRDVAIMQEEVQRGDQARAQLEARIRTLQKERKFLLSALFVCVGLLVVC